MERATQAEPERLSTPDSIRRERTEFIIPPKKDHGVGGEESQEGGSGEPQDEESSNQIRRPHLGQILQSPIQYAEPYIESISKSLYPEYVYPPFLSEQGKEGRTHGNRGASTSGMPPLFSLHRSGNRIIGGNTQPEVVVPKSPRRIASLQAPRLRENVQATSSGLAHSSLNERSGAGIQPPNGGQEGFALYGNFHDIINQDHPLPRDLGLHYVGINACFGGLPVTIRVAANLHNTTVDVVLSDNTHIQVGNP